MKKLILIIPIFLILFNSCSPKMIPRQRIVSEYYFDYSNYAKEGFMISPDPYIGGYEPCGEIQITVYPAKIIKKGKDIYNPSSNSYESKEYLTEESISAQELLNMIVKKSIEKGANALSNFKCILVKNSYYDKYTGRSIDYFSHYELSGFAIKRK
jgi:hypothetical protein